MAVLSLKQITTENQKPGQEKKKKKRKLTGRKVLQKKQGQGSVHFQLNPNVHLCYLIFSLTLK